MDKLVAAKGEVYTGKKQKYFKYNGLINTYFKSIILSCLSSEWKCFEHFLVPNFLQLYFTTVLVAFQLFR